MKSQPVIFKWTEIELVDAETGEARRQMAMLPQDRFRFVCRRQFEPGGDYTLIPHEQRSQKSHSFFFACVKEAFDNLPESLAPRFPSAEHLRAWALIETGFFDEKEFEYEGVNAKRYAHSLATFIRTQDDFARISLHQITPQKYKVLVRVAKSQSHTAMNKEQFEKSKSAVLDLLEHMITVPRGTLKKNAGRSA